MTALTLSETLASTPPYSESHDYWSRLCDWLERHGFPTDERMTPDAWTMLRSAITVRKGWVTHVVEVVSVERLAEASVMLEHVNTGE